MSKSLNSGSQCHNNFCKHVTEGDINKILSAYKNAKYSKQWIQQKKQQKENERIIYINTNMHNLTGAQAHMHVLPVRHDFNS